MSFKGDIPSISLCDVVQNLATNQKTGTLMIQNDGLARHIQFREGKIVSYADDADFSVLDWLTDKGIVPEKHRDEIARRYNKAKKKTLGEILQEAGLLSLEKYKAYITGLASETLCEVFSFREGTFEFHEGELDEEHGDREMVALGIAFNAMTVMMEAARRADEWQRIRKHIPSEHEIYLCVPSEREQLLAEAGHDIVRRALQLMDGTRPLKQVIDKLPYSRFDACRALATLISEKKVRPLDGELLLQGSLADQHPKKAIPCLETILEREPNNREILKRLADLNEKEGNREESATYNKRLAISYLDEDDLEKAEMSLRKSLLMNPKDVAAWQKLWDTVQRQGDREKMALFGRQYVDHFKKLGLMEIARDHLVEMVKLFPAEAHLKVDLAETRFALGDRKDAVQGLSDAAYELLKKNSLEEAEKLFSKLVKWDPENQKARELCKKIRSGKLARRREEVRRFVHNAVYCLLFITLCGYLIREVHVHGEVLQVTRTVFADSLVENRRYEEAIRRIQAVQDAYPFSIAAAYKIPELVQALREKQSRPPGSHDAAKKSSSPVPSR